MQVRRGKCRVAFINTFIITQAHIITAVAATEKKNSQKNVPHDRIFFGFGLVFTPPTVTTTTPTNLHPDSIMKMAKIISMSVFGATFPKPTDTRPVNTK